MSKNNLSYTISLLMGISIIVLSCIIKTKANYIIMGLGIAIIGFFTETYFKKRKDTITSDGKSRNEIEITDERNILINAKSGETTNYIMTFTTLVAFITAKYLNVSLTGMIIILSLIVIRQVVNFISNRYYQNRI